MFCVEACIDWPMRCVTASSRSDTARASSACRPDSTSPMVCTRPAVSDWMRAISAMRSSSSLGMDVVARGFLAARARAARQHDRDRAEQREHHAGKAGERFADGDGDAADDEEGLGHGRLVARFALTGTKHEHERPPDRQLELCPFTPGSALTAPSWGARGNQPRREKRMRKFILMALAGTAIALAAPRVRLGDAAVARQRPRRRGRQCRRPPRRCSIAAGTVVAPSSPLHASPPRAAAAR